MASNRTLDILVKLTGAERLVQQFNQIEKTGTKSAKEVRESFGEVVPAFGAVNQQASTFLAAVKNLPPAVGIAALAIAGLAMQVKLLSTAFRELDAASQRTGVLRQTQLLSGGVSQARADLQALQRLEGRTLSMSQLAQLRNSASTRGIDLETFKEIVATADELATVTGRDLIPTIEQLNQAVGTGTVRAFASAGADVRALIKEFGEGRLTIEETRLVMQRLRDQVDGSGDSVSDSLNSMKRAGKDAWDAMLNSWAENPTLILGLQGIATAVDKVSDSFVFLHTKLQEVYRAWQQYLGISGGGRTAAGPPGSGTGLGNKAAGYVQVMREDGTTEWVKADGAQNVTDWTHVPGRGWVPTAQLERERAEGYRMPGEVAAASSRGRTLAPRAEREREWSAFNRGTLEFWEAQIERQRAATTPRRAGRRFADAQAEYFMQRSRDVRGALPMIPPPPLPGTPRPNGGGTNADELALLLQAGVDGGASGLIGTGVGMVAANTLSAASLLGSAGGPVGMVLGTLVGSLFQQRQRETIRGPIAVEDKRVADILGALNSTMNELIRLSTAGGADRLFADAARQAVAL